MSKPNENQLIRRWGIISIIAILFLELSLDRLLLQSFSLQQPVAKISVAHLCFALALIAFLLSAYSNRTYIFRQNGRQKEKSHRLTDALKTLIKNSVSGDPLDLIFVLFFLCHLTWIPDSIFEFVKNDPEIDLFCLRLARPGIYILGLLFAIRVKPHYPKQETDEAKVCISAISNIYCSGDTYSFDAFILPLRLEPSIEKVIVFYSETMSCAKDNKTITNLREWGVSDQTINELIISCEFSPDLLEKVLCDALAVYNVTNPQLIPCNYDNLGEVLSDVKKTVAQLMESSDYKDENLLFNLMPGTKNVSIALGIHSVKGKRGACYFRQGKNTVPLKERYEKVTLDVFELKDIFSELTD